MSNRDSKQAKYTFLAAERREHSSAGFQMPLLTVVVLSLAVGCARSRVQETARHAEIEAQVREAPYAPAPAKPLTLEDAIQLALQYNFDAAVKQLERDIQVEVATGAKLAMLPSFTAKRGQSRRSNEPASSSESFETRRETLEPSVSAMRIGSTWNLNAAWNILDFGLSYLRARQATEEIRIRDLRYQRARQGLSLDVAEAYWQVVISKQVMTEARALLEKAKRRRARIIQQIRRQDISELKGLEKQRKLVQMQIRLREHERTYRKAYIDLARLIGLTPGAKYELAEVEIGAPPALPEAKLGELEQEALYNRPELAELSHREQIQLDEVRATIVRMFPSLNLFFNREHNDNPFLTHRTWHTVGMSASWTLLSLPRRWREKRAGVKRVELTRHKRMALAIGIVAQVHLTMLDLENILAQCQEALELNALEQKLFVATKKYQERREADESAVLEKEANAFFGRVRYLNLYANYMVTRARLDNTLGRNLGQPAAAASSAEEKDAPEKKAGDARPDAPAGEETLGRVVEVTPEGFMKNGEVQEEASVLSALPEEIVAEEKPVPATGVKVEVEDSSPAALANPYERSRQPAAASSVEEKDAPEKKSGDARPDAPAGEETLERVTEVTPEMFAANGEVLEEAPVLSVLLEEIFAKEEPAPAIGVTVEVEDSSPAALANPYERLRKLETWRK